MKSHSESRAQSAPVQWAVLFVSFFFFSIPKGLQAQHISIELPYSFNVPLGELGDNMDPIHSFHLETLYRFRDSRISVGLGFKVGRYDRYREDELVEFDNTTILAPVIVNHRLSTLMATARYDLNEGGPFTPYLTMRVGWGFLGSHLQVRDPERTEGSEGVLNLFEDNLHRSNTFLGGLGVGAQFDLSRILRRVGRERLYFSGEISFIAGPEVDYSFSQRKESLRYNIDGTMAGSQNYEVVEHDLHTTERYKSVLLLTSIKVGIMYRIDLSGKSKSAP